MTKKMMIYNISGIKDMLYFRKIDIRALLIMMKMIRKSILINNPINYKKIRYPPNFRPLLDASEIAFCSYKIKTKLMQKIEKRNNFQFKFLNRLILMIIKENTIKIQRVILMMTNLRINRKSTQFK